MGHYDDPIQAETTCDRCGNPISYTWKHGEPEYCSHCKEQLQKPENVTTDIDIEVDTDESEVRVTVTFTNENEVPIDPGVHSPDDSEELIGVVGWLRLEAGDAVAENVWLQNSHVMDVGRRFKIKEKGTNAVSSDNTRSMTFTWTEDGVNQEKVPTMKFEGEVGQGFRDRVSIHSGDPLDADEIHAEFHPEDGEWFDSAEETVSVPEHLIEL